MTSGILAMGKINPESNMAGNTKKKALIMACCWVSTDGGNEESYSQGGHDIKPGGQQKQGQIPPDRDLKPENSDQGNQNYINETDQSVKGTVFPRMNSLGVMGVTMICSMVPISFSRTTAILVNKRVTSMTNRAITPGT